MVSASSLWTIIDKTTRHVVMKPEGLAHIPIEHHKDDISLPEKVVGEANNLVDTRKVKYTEIDLNGHLNNTQYVEFLLDTHEPEFYKAHKIKSIIMCYDKEIKGGNIVKLYSNNSNPEIIKGMVGEGVHFSALLNYEKRIIK